MPGTQLHPDARNPCRPGKGKPADEDIAAARQGLKRISEIISSGQYSVVILDEANVAVSTGLLAVEDLLAIIDLKPGDTELIITGRNAAEQIIDRADLVSEINAVKHYFEKGVKARIGIEK